MKCNLIINTDYVKVTIINNSNWVIVTNYKFADANSTVNIPLEFLEDADASCVATSVGTISGNTLSVPVTTSNVTVTLTNAKAQVRVENNVQYHVTGITPSVQYVTAGQSAQFTLTYAEGYTPTDLCATIGTVNNTTLIVPTQASDIYVDTTIFRGSIENVELGVSSTGSHGSLPTNMSYKYDISQQLYASSELGNSGTIRTISFKNTSSKDFSRQIDIYMENVNTTFISSWTQVTNAQKVYSGLISFTHNDWTTITLDTPFDYDNTKNLLITVHDNTGVSNDTQWFATYTRSGNYNYEAVFNKRSTTPYDISQITTYGGESYTSSKNSIKLFKMNVIEDGPDPEPVLEPLVIEIGKLTEADTTPDVAHVPSNTSYKYFLSEQIYLASEIGVSGTITDIALYHADNSAFTRDWDIYLVHTELSQFPNNGQYYDYSTNAVIHPTSSDLVYSGPVEFTVVGASAKGWKTIHLDTPFVYDGIHNLCLIIYDRTGTKMTSAHSFKSAKTPTNNRVALHTFEMSSLYPDGTQVDPTVPSVVTVANLTRFRNFIQISIIPES